MPINSLNEMSICSECKLCILRSQGYQIKVLLPTGQEISLYLCPHCLPLAIWKRTEEEMEKNEEIRL
jgi:hypothetical protein